MRVHSSVYTRTHVRQSVYMYKTHTTRTNIRALAVHINSSATLSVASDSFIFWIKLAHTRRRDQWA